MKVLRVLLFIIIGIVLLWLILAAIGPAEVKFERSIEIDAPKEVVWEHVNSLEDMEKWSPWAKMDTAMEVTYTGEEGEVGSKYSWESDVDSVGIGSQEITKVVPNDSIVTHLEFKKPWESESDAWVHLESTGPQKTEVSWGLYTEIGLINRPIMLFMDLEKALEKDYNKGLKNLKDWVESGDMMEMTKEYEVMEYQLEAQNYMVQSDTVQFSEMHDQFQEVGQAIHMAMKEGKISPTGPLVGIYYSWDTTEMKTHLAIGVPTDQETAAEGFELLNMEEQPALMINYYGPYEGSGAAHNYMSEYAMENKIEFQGPVIERYVTDPSEQPDTMKWLTEIIYPIAE